MAATLEDEVAELWRANAELQRRLDEATARESATAAVLKESLEYQTATSAVLKVISRSTFDLQPVLDTLVKTAARLCCADIAHIAIRDGEVYRPKARFAMSLELDLFVKDQTFMPDRGTITARTLLEKRIVHVVDVAADLEMHSLEGQRLGGFRSVLGVPLMRDDVVIGAIVLGRLRVEPFTDKQIELVTTFADQAVIAIDNARLITDTREALDQQTATAEVLQVINSSPGDLAPVFDAMLEKAMRLCEAAFGFMTVVDGERSRTVAARGVPAAYAAFRERNPTPANAPIASRVRKGEPFIHTVDLKAERFYEEGEPQRRAIVDLGGARTLLAVPLMRDRAVLGAIQVYRTDVRPFSDKQIALLQNFAAQAVIAMENARLLTETREALDQQTATAEVLQVINSSPGDLTPVFDAILEKAHTLCEAATGSLRIIDGDMIRTVAIRGYSGELADLFRSSISTSGAQLVEALRDGAPFVHIIDVAESHDPISGLFVASGNRAVLVVPLRKDNSLLGMIVAGRKEARPFTDKQIALLQNFAAQAVIAVENARLITETREALAQQTATAEVLQVINSSPGDLAPVFEAMLERALELCGAALGTLYTYDGESMHAVAVRGAPPELAQYLRGGPQRPGGGGLGRLVRGEPIVQIADVSADPAYDTPLGRALIEFGKVRTNLVVPIAVGMPIAGHPPHGSGRAQFEHPAPTLGV
jgi:GAF domain-containing protein